MRGITISYKYSGDEAPWQSAMAVFITAINNDPVVAGKFTYQVAIADDKETRVHWGRWDKAETLAHLQAQGYFKTFAGQVRGFAGGAPSAKPHDIAFKSSGW
ncbi:MAG: hypothetical protein HRU33_01085 [Rhodobacteraceae bacterium]|nr:hypothetical protein [Paracoccaceae bacterium]